MKPSCKPGLIAAALMLAAAAAPTLAAAHTVRSRPASGTVETLDSDTMSNAVTVAGTARRPIATRESLRSRDKWQMGTTLRVPGMDCPDEIAAISRLTSG